MWRDDGVGEKCVGDMWRDDGVGEKCVGGMWSLMLL